MAEEKDGTMYKPIRRRGTYRLSREQWGCRSMWEEETEGREFVTDQLVVSKEGAPVDVAQYLAIPPGGPVCTRSRRYSVDGRPVELATSYLPWDMVRGTPITQVNTGRGGIYARLAVLGLKPVRFTEEATVRTATEDEASKLDLQGCLCGFPGCGPQVIAIQRVAYASEGQPVEAAKMVLDASAYILEYNIGA